MGEVCRVLEVNQIELTDKGTINARYQFDGIPYTQTKDCHAEVSKVKGKVTRKWFHVSIYRMDSGRYELTLYLA
jgi:hypothetical protein